LFLPFLLFFSSNPGFKKSFLFTTLDAEKPVIRVIRDFWLVRQGL
jgi:hypothetical protein